MAQAALSFHDLASPVSLTKPRGGRPEVRGSILGGAEIILSLPHL